MTVPLLIQSQLARFVFHHLLNDLLAMCKALAAGKSASPAAHGGFLTVVKRQSIKSNSTPQLRSCGAQSQKAEGQL